VAATTCHDAAAGARCLLPAISPNSDMHVTASTPRTDPAAVARSALASPPLPLARKKARPRKTPPDKGRLGIDIFALWEKAGRTNTPVSIWSADRRHRDKEHVGGLNGSTLRATIIGPARVTVPRRRMRIEDDEDESRTANAPTAFEGMWISTGDGELRGRIVGHYLIWEEDNSRTTLKFIGSKSSRGLGDVVSMTFDGESHSGVLSEDGHVLRWRDGDRWLRLDESFDRMLAYCEHKQQLPEDYSFQGWVTTNKCVMSSNMKSLSRPSTGSSWRSHLAPRPATHHCAARHAVIRSSSPTRQRSSSPRRERSSSPTRQSFFSQTSSSPTRPFTRG